MHNDPAEPIPPCIYRQDYPDAVLPGFCQQLERLALACCRLAGRLLAAVQEALLNQQTEPGGDQQQQQQQQQQQEQQQQNGDDEAKPEHIPTSRDRIDQKLVLQELTLDPQKTSDPPLTTPDPPQTTSDPAQTTSDPALTSRGPLTAGHRRMLLSGGCSSLRVLSYPPVPEEAAAAGAIRCAPHTDYGTLTLLFQDQLGGLEVSDPRHTRSVTRGTRSAVDRLQ